MHNYAFSKQISNYHNSFCSYQHMYDRIHMFILLVPSKIIFHHLKLTCILDQKSRQIQL